MSTTNKRLDLIFRCGIFLSLILTVANQGIFLSGLKNIKIEGLDENNFIERFLGAVNDFSDGIVIYSITIGVLAVCTVLSLMTRYKARLTSMIFRTSALAVCTVSYLSGLTAERAVSKLTGYAGVTVSAAGRDSLMTCLSSQGVSADDVTFISDTLTDTGRLFSLCSAMFLIPSVLAVLTVTSIHCFIKHSDPNAPASGEA